MRKKTILTHSKGCKNTTFTLLPFAGETAVKTRLKGHFGLPAQAAKLSKYTETVRHQVLTWPNAA